MFLFSDTQIKLESFLEDINNILNTGEVPNLFAKDETAQIVDAVQERAAGLPETATKAEYFKFFVAECRRNLHLVLCFCVGDAFRERLRKFPSLVNCCTIDWFSEWPSDARCSRWRASFCRTSRLTPRRRASRASTRARCSTPPFATSR